MEGLVGERTINATLGPMALVLKWVSRPVTPHWRSTCTPHLAGSSQGAGVCARSSVLV